MTFGVTIVAWHQQETLGVTVATFGPTTEFPAFFSSKSGHQVSTHHLKLTVAMVLVGV